MVVSVSHDGGVTWNGPHIVHTDGVDASGNIFATPFFNDKEWIAADPNDSNTAYVSWTLFGPSGSPIVLSVTHDGGNTWSAPVQVTPAFVTGGITPFDQGSFPLVNSHGTLFIAYYNADPG